MNNKTPQAPTITLNDQFDRLVVHGPGIMVEFENGEINVLSGTVRRPLKAYVPLTARAERTIGEVISNAHFKLNNGLVYGGLTPDGLHLLVDQEDVKGTDGNRVRVTFHEAAVHADKRRMEVPSKGDLELLCKNAREIGGFDCSKAGAYWSSTDLKGQPGYAWFQNFKDGYQGYQTKDFSYQVYRAAEFYVRCVRRCSII